MSADILLQLSDTPITGHFQTEEDKSFFSTDLIPLFWLSLFSKEDIRLYQSNDEDEYSFYFLQIDRINAINNFQKYFGIWIHFNEEAFQLSSLFLEFLKNRSEQYLTLRLDDLYAMWDEPDSPLVRDDMIEMLDFFPKFHKNPNLKKVKAPNYVALSIDLYLNDHLRNGLDADMFQLAQSNQQTQELKSKNQLKSFFSNLFK